MKNKINDGWCYMLNNDSKSVDKMETPRSLAIS